MVIIRVTVVALLVALAMGGPTQAKAVSWPEAQKLKVEQLEKAAANAVAQQRTTHFPPQPLKADFSGTGGVKVEPSDAWDADGDGKCLKVTVTDIPENYSHTGIRDRLHVRFGRPVNLLEKATGFAFWIKANEPLSKDLRFGVYFKVQGADGKDPVVISDIPLRHKFGDNPHLAYVDWGYVFDHTVGVFKVPPKDFFTRVTGFDLTIVQRRLPREDVKLKPVSGSLLIDGLQLVDWYDGSYDSDRFPKDGRINAASRIVSQGRTQQVARICAEFGGQAGLRSAIRAMDMMARIQCWDGSWPEMRTRLQGEFTHGMILADLAWAYDAMKKAARPELKETVKTRHWNMKREALYEQILYRGAMSRSPAPSSSYADSYVRGKGSLLSGCNRPMIFAFSQYVAAGVLSDKARKKEIMAQYDRNVDDLLAHQGVTAGGWPIFGEGDRYSDKGLHWDCSYTTDHIFIMTQASRVTGDKRWGEMIKKFCTVVEAMVLPNGYEIDGGLSERGRAKRGGLKAPDLAFQEARRWGATELAQWGANASKRVWSQWPRGGSLWPSCSSFRGYALGAFLTWQCYDLQAEPEPRDLGHVFPRQWPIWTARWMNKEGKEARLSKLIITPAGEMVNTFKWEVGQYPVLKAIPLAITVEGETAVEIEPLGYEGDVGNLKAEGPIMVLVQPTGKDERSSSRQLRGEKVSFEISSPAKVRFFSEARQKFIQFRAIPRKNGTKVKLTCRLLTKPEPYKHLYAEASSADVDLGRGGVNLVGPATGTKIVPIKCFPSGQYVVDRALDNNQGTAWVIGQFKAGAGLRFEFAREAPLAKLVLSQGDWQGKFHLAKELTVTLSDGSSRKMSLEKKPGTNVEVDLGGVRAKSLTLTIDSIYEVADNEGNVGGWMEMKILTAASKP